MSRGHRAGLDVKCDVSTCMVKDCGRKALYRARSGTQRGYCRIHKGEILTPGRANEVDAFSVLVSSETMNTGRD